MLFFVLPAENRVVAYQKDVGGADHFTIDFALNDKVRMAEQLSQFKFGAPRPANGRAQRSYLDMTVEERLEFALTRPQNLRTGAEHRNDHPSFYVDSAENLLEKVRSGITLNQKQVNLSNMIYDAAARRSNFSHLQDYGA